MLQIFRGNQFNGLDDLIFLNLDAVNLGIKLISMEEIEIFLQYYSYCFPVLPIDSGYVQSIIKKISLGKLSTITLQKWHLILITYKSKILNVKLIFQDIEQIVFTSEIINQFSLTHFTFDFSQKINIELFGQVIFFKLYTCFEELDETFACHFSCQTCDAPFENACLSCSLESKRIYNSQDQTCHCSPWSQELNVTKCYEEDSQIEYQAVDTVHGYDQIYDGIICSFGYFLYNDECFQCPFANLQNSTQCLDCLLDWENWIFSARCTNGNDFSQFIFVDNEFVVCHYCEYISLSQAVYSDRYYLDHLNQPTFVQCIEEYMMNTQNCAFFQNSPDALKDDLSICTSHQRYDSCICRNLNDVVLLDNQHGQKCTIPKCKKCFSYTIIKGEVLTKFAAVDYLSKHIIRITTVLLAALNVKMVIYMINQKMNVFLN